MQAGRTGAGVLAAVFLFSLPAFPQDAADIVRRSVDRDWTDFSSRQNYTYEERSQFRQYSRDGKPTKIREETNEILIFGGRPYERLIARDGRTLSEHETQKEQ